MKYIVYSPCSNYSKTIVFRTAPLKPGELNWRTHVLMYVHNIYLRSLLITPLYE
jgi:hypothetical protein